MSAVVRADVERLETPPAARRASSLKGQFVATVAARVLGSGIQAVTFVLLGRSSSVLVLGVVGAVLGAGGFAGAIFDCGMATFLSRSRALGREVEVRAGLRLNLVTTLAFGGSATALLGALAGWGALPAGVLALGFAMALEKNVETALAIPIADGNRLVPAVSVVLRRAATLVLFLVLLAAHVEALPAYALAYLAAGVAGQLHLRPFLARAVVSGPAAGRDMLRVARAGLPFLVSNVTAQARALDATVVGLLGSPFQAGLYAAATRLSSPLLLIPATLTTLVVPHAARRSPRDTRRLAVRLSVAFLGTLVPFGLGALLSGPVVELLFGPRFAPAAPALAVTLLALPFVALSSPLGSILQSKGHERFVAANGMLFAVLLVVAMAVAASLLGAIGVALAVGLVFLTKCVSLGVVVHRRVR